MKKAIHIVCVAALIVGIGTVEGADVFNMPTGLTSLETVHVGNPGNTGDTEIMSWDGTTGHGAVNYAYNIGKYEVTAGQYTEFLNAVAGVDVYGLYNTHMWEVFYGCKIDRKSSPGGYQYSVAADRANRPVNYVSWGDAARFANWLHNGQPTGTLTGDPLQDAGLTEDGSYFLNGATSSADLQAVVRDTDNATWVIPTEDEWYKAAYHKNDGVTGNYFDYPTSSDSTPSNDLTEPTDLGNNATFSDNGLTIDMPLYRTEVGEHENSDSPYGTFDQAGNVHEWTEEIIEGGASDSIKRGLQGGGYTSPSTHLHASFNSYLSDLNYEYRNMGFRVAEVPEPATLSMLALGGLAIIRRKSRR